jgi:heat shock protein HtpX
MAAYGLYTHIKSNRRRSIFLLIGLFFLVYLLTYAGALTAEAFLDSYQDIDWYIFEAWRDLKTAIPIVTVLTAIWIVISYYFHQAIIDAVTGGKDVTRQDQPRLYNLLENLCISRGIPMPKLKVMESNALNAFATGMNQKQYSITVTSGLLKQLDDPEVEAVLAHELTHIRNGDVRMLVIAVIIAGVVSFFAELVFRIVFHTRWSGGSGRSSGGDKKGGAAGAIIIAIVMVAVAWALSIVIRFALSRSREFLADAGSVELTKNPDGMISALRKIEGRGELVGATSAVMEMCVDNPRNEFTDLFATHPSVDKRVEALVKFAGGRDPGPIALPAPEEPAEAEDGETDERAEAEADATEQSQKPLQDNADKPFLPDEAPVVLGGDAPPRRGPWGFFRRK